MDYLLKASGLVVILFLFYKVFLKNETFFKSIRSYFLIGLILVVAIPIIEIPIYVEQVVTNINSINYSNLSIENFKTEQNSINWLQLTSILYIIGVVIFTLKFLIQLVSLGKLFSTYKFIKQGSYYFVETSKNISPFSFFNIIIYNKSQFTIEELEQIINHEKAHVLQWHSVDTILAHLLVITLWFNPFVWLYKKAVEQNLEFLADEYALELAQNQQLYQFTLLKTCSETYCSSITNNFYNSLIKKRILMLQKNRSSKKGQWKYALLLPILAAFIFTFNTKIIAQEKKLLQIEEIDKLKIELIIDNKTTDDNLKNEAAFFKKQFDVVLTFKGIKRNAQGEITAIKIEAKDTNSTTIFENNEANPIKPIKITFDSENNTTSIGNVKELSKKHFTYKTKKGDDINFEIKPSKESNFVFISSDGEKITWIANDTINLIGDKIILQKDNDNQVEFQIHEEDNASENVFILKTNGEKGEKHKVLKKESALTYKIDKVKPLYIVDGIEIDAKKMEEVNSNSIESVNVLKGENATEKYGVKGKNGIIEIKLKDTDNSKNIEPLFIVDDKETPAKTAKEINPDKIKSVNVIKGDKAIEKYGDKGKNGIIEIITKKD